MSKHKKDEAKKEPEAHKEMSMKEHKKAFGKHKDKKKK